MNRVVIALRLIARQLQRQKQTAAPAGSSRTSASPPQKGMGILSIAVHPAHERQGAGTQLMKTVEALVLKRGYDWLDLSVDPHNFGAIHFYDHLGWHTAGTNIGGTGIMKKTLGS
jgi:ribosomal protein S18 acetylase RimI-like enzyme